MNTKELIKQRGVRIKFTIGFERLKKVIQFVQSKLSKK